MVPDISEDDIGKIGRNLGEKAYWPFVDQYGMQAVISMALVKWVAFEEVDDEETE